MILLIDMLIDNRDGCSQHKLDVSKTRQKFHVKLKPNVDVIKRRPSRVPMHLKKKLEKLVTLFSYSGYYSRNGRPWRNGIALC